MYTYIHIYVYTYIHIYIYTYIHIYICTYIHIYIYIQRCADVFNRYCSNSFRRQWIECGSKNPKNMHTYTYIYMHVCVYMCVYINIYIYICIYIHIYVFTCIHIFIYICRCANVLVSLLVELFPSSVDRMRLEESKTPGERPMLLPDVTPLELFYLIHRGKESTAPAEFGANQCIIVRNLETQEKVRIDFPKALVMTVEECKGLEFEDCIIYNFFSDSDAGARVLWLGVLRCVEICRCGWVCVCLCVRERGR